MSEQELQRQAKHRLAVIRHAHEVTGNVPHSLSLLRDQVTTRQQMGTARSRTDTDPQQVTACAVEKGRTSNEGPC